MYWTFVATLAAATLCAAFAAIAGRHGVVSFPISLSEHFVLHYALGFAMLSIIAGFLYWRSTPRPTSKWVIWAPLLGILGNIAIAATARLSLAVPTTTTRLTGDVTLLLANVLRRNPDSARLCALAKRTDPDLIALVEPDQRWLDDMTACMPALHYVGTGRDDNFGIALLSRWPIECASGAMPSELSPCVHAIGSPFPTIVATVKIDSAVATTLIVTHPIPPIARELAISNRAQMDEIALRIASTQGPVVVAGDLNATPWSGALRRFVARAGLHDSRPWYAYHASWPASLGPLGIPIDHVLGNRQVVFTNRIVASEIGSDHLPVVVRFHLQK